MSLLNNVHSFVASAFRGTRGLRVRPSAQSDPPRPEQLLEVFEFESCPFCKKVRETLSELDLAYIARTAPHGGSSTRQALEDRTGTQQFPFLIDPNTGTELFESEDIIDYLFQTYGDGRAGWQRALAPLNSATAAMSSAVRPRGGRVEPGCAGREQPAERPVLYNFEASPYCRKVREKLCSLNLNYEVRNVAKQSARRPELVERGGQMMVPYLIDPNTGAEMYESDDIVDYLAETYGA
jgi:glutathione S-transferase